MARPQLGRRGAPEARTVGVRVTAGRGGRAAGASPSRAALHGGLPAPPWRWGSGCGWRQSCGWGRRSYGSLNRIGVNLNQMARALNSRAVSSPAETQEAVERVGELVAKLLAGERE